MSRRILAPLPDTIVSAQRRAADPGGSVWVSANAGSGKTYVLTERVLRLLLCGVPPEQILCLTYTKAAAAEMRGRIAGRLAEWALADDTALAAGLARLDGGHVTDAVRRRARTLFAHALDTPGGLKIVTIHAFCESVLHRFPVEAGVPFDFSVIEEAERDDLIRMAYDRIVAAGLRGEGPAVDAVETLFALLSDHQIGSAVNSALADGRRLRPLLAGHAAAKARLRQLTGYQGRTPAEIDAEIASGYTLDRADHQRVAALCATVTGRTFAGRLAEIEPGRPAAEALCGAFLTGDEAVPKTGFPDSGIRKGDPALAARLTAEAQRLEALCAEKRLAALIARSEALIDLLGAVIDAYQRYKRARSRLDFDDLIDKARALFSDRAAGAWVRYKLDAGITHMLVDESQDTNPEQWAVIDAMVAEFFAGEGAVQAPRTVFGVGDEKQSIYSFQGAEPALFGRYGRHYARRSAEVALRFENVRLETSFRTLGGILAAVDRVFAREDIREAVLAPPDSPVHHETARAEPGGRITLWPPLRQPDGGTRPAWPVTATPEADRSAPRQLAERIAGEIAGWVASSRPLGPRAVPVGYDDVLILVQTRGPLFHEIIRALTMRGIPTPGADRLSVSSHIAVRDLLALADVLVNTREDLQLAAVLRSPLFGLCEDELYAVAHAREGTLWRALERSGLPAAKAAFAALHDWRGRLDFDRPYGFFAHVLYAEGGLKRFHARLGGEVDDVFSEFLGLALEHEQKPQPSLQGFLAEMRQRHVSIRREMPGRGAGVRVMTVHGAKGLEAPIVILADAASKPAGQQLAKPVVIAESETGPVLIHGSRKQQVEATRPFVVAAEAAQRAEYWRKLYVGMTRAEDELYVTGTLTARGDPARQLQGSWYEAIESVLRPDCRVVTDAEGAETALIHAADGGAGEAVIAAAAPAAVAAPDPVLPPLPPYDKREIIRPSAAFEGIESARSLDTLAERVRDAEAARRQGLALHALLQHLARVPAGDRPALGRKAMPALLPEDPDAHEALLARACSILARPQFAALFGPESRAELPFLIDGERHGRPIRLAGRIDRLAVVSGSVLVVDFKSDAAPPAGPAGVPMAYRTQLGLYALVACRLFPAMVVKPAILWTALESLMFLPEEMLAESVEGFTIR